MNRAIDDMGEEMAEAWRDLDLPDFVTGLVVELLDMVPDAPPESL